jgi:hypothetical protein
MLFKSALMAAAALSSLTLAGEQTMALLLITQ